MKKLLFVKLLSCSILILALAAAGCGGGKKKSQAEGSPNGAVSGKVDLFGGFGAALDAAGRADMLAGGATVKLYRMQPDGGGLVPIDGSKEKPLQNGSFRIDGAPIEERNLILRVEAAGSQPILAAILPPLLSGDNTVAVTPETDLEVLVLTKLAQTGISGDKDVKAWEIDASFVKQLVGDGLFFDMPGPENPAATADSLLPVARASYNKLLKSLFGNDAKATDPPALKLFKDIAGPLARVETAYDTGTGVAAARAAADPAVAAAVRDAGPAVETLNETAVWQTARRGALLWAAGCFSEKKEYEECPLPAKDAVDLAAYGPSLEYALESRWAAEDFADRMDAVWPASAAATGAAYLPPVDTIKKLLNLPDKFFQPFEAARNEIAGKSDPELRAALRARWMANLRDNLLVGVVGMDAGAVYGMLDALYSASQPLAAASGRPSPVLAQVGEAHRAFIDACDTAFQPLRAAVRTRFPRLEAQDQGKIEWALRVIVMNSALSNLPPAFYTTADTDRDGQPDNEERVIGTDPADKGSIASPAVAGTPASMLPPPPADADGDGSPDAVEKAVGTNPSGATSAPKPGRMDFCKERSAVCLEPVEGDSIGGKTSVAGTVVYKDKPFSGAVVGVYGAELFGDAAPAAASAAAGADGAFGIEKAPRGRYFVVAFVDADGDGRPGPGEAVGFAGGLYPRRYAAGAEPLKLSEPVRMFGLYGAAKCSAGLFFDPTAGACAGQCPQGMVQDDLSRLCLCGEGKLLVEPGGQCADSCPETTKKDPAGRRCACPQGTSPDPAQGKCVCPEGMFLDQQALNCRCRSGVLNEITMTCVEKCPATLAMKVDTGSCACPDNSKWDEAAGRCVCAGGIMHPFEAKCVDACPGGLAPDETGAMCKCREKEEYDYARHDCVCAKGLERNAAGRCMGPDENRTPPTGQPPGQGPVGSPTGGRPGFGPPGAPPASGGGAAPTTGQGRPPTGGLSPVTDDNPPAPGGNP